MLSLIVVFALVGPRPVHSWSIWTVEVEISAEGVLRFASSCMGHLLSASSAGLNTTKGEETMEPRRQRVVDLTPLTPRRGP